MKLETMTIKEGLARILDGENITVMVPADLSTMWIEDLKETQDNGGFCVRTSDLNRKEKEQDPEPVPDEAEGDKAEQAEEDKPKRRKLDTGKIKALADAGWSAQQIADKMNVSMQTIYYHLNK